MHFLSLLRNHASPSYIASVFIDDLNEQSILNGELCLRITRNFIDDCLASIGLDCELQENDFIAGFENYAWPTEKIQSYTFEFNPQSSLPIEEFLARLGLEVHKAYEQSNDHPHSMSPIDWFMELMGVWCWATRSLLQYEKEVSSSGQSYLEEPLSRIDFFLLASTNFLRNKHGANFSLLNGICHRLLENSNLGIYFQDSHKLIAEGLIEIFEKDFYKFYLASEDALNLYKKLLTVDKQTPTHMETYNSLVNILNNHENQVELAALTTFLASDAMQKIYCSSMKGTKSQKYLLQLLLFLRTMQSKLPNTDWMTQTCLEKLLSLAIVKNSRVPDKAAELYVTIMKRRTTDDCILQHVVETFFREAQSLVYVEDFMHCMLKHCDHMKDLNIYLNLLITHSINARGRELCIMLANFLQVTFGILWQDKSYSENYDWQVRFLIQLTATLHHGLQYREFIFVIGVLSDIFLKIDFEKLWATSREFGTLARCIDSFAADMFLSRIDFPLKPFISIWMSIKPHIKSISLPRTLSYIINDFKEFEAALETSDAPQNSVLRNYRNTLMKLESIFQNEHIDSETLSECIRTLNRIVIQEQTIFAYEQSKLFIDCYAVNALFFAIVSGNEMEENFEEDFKAFLFEVAQNLGKLLIEKMKNVGSTVSIFRIHTFVCRFIELKLFFKDLELNSEIYDTLMNLISVYAFKRPIEAVLHNDPDRDTIHHLQRILDYQSEMLRDCNILHNCQFIYLDGHTLYKVCFYYGHVHSHNDMLKTILLTLASKRFEIYKRIVPLIIYNLYKVRPALSVKQIEHCIRLHINLVDETTVENKWYLKVHVVMIVLELLSKFISKDQVNRGGDRLFVLKHLPMWLEELNSIVDPSIEPIMEELRKIVANNFLLPHEIETYNTFLSYLEVNTFRNPNQTSNSNE